MPFFLQQPRPLPLWRQLVRRPRRLRHLLQSQPLQWRPQQEALRPTRPPLLFKKILFQPSSCRISPHVVPTQHHKWGICALHSTRILIYQPRPTLKTCFKRVTMKHPPSATKYMNDKSKTQIFWKSDPATIFESIRFGAALSSATLNARRRPFLVNSCQRVKGRRIFQGKVVSFKRKRNSYLFWIF